MGTAVDNRTTDVAQQENEQVNKWMEFIKTNEKENKYKM